MHDNHSGTGSRTRVSSVLRILYKEFMKAMYDSRYTIPDVITCQDHKLMYHFLVSELTRDVHDAKLY
jgi:hypothetical protein